MFDEHTGPTSGWGLSLCLTNETDDHLPYCRYRVGTSLSTVKIKGAYSTQEDIDKMAEFNVDSLKQRTGITDKQLDSDVDARVLQEIAKHFRSCERIVGPAGFNLNESQKADVERSVNHSGQEVGMFKALTFWRKRNPSVKYQHLIEIVLKLEGGLLAEQLCQIGEFQS